MSFLAPMQLYIDPATGNDNYGGGFDPTSGVPGTNYAWGAGSLVISWLAASGTYTNNLQATNVGNSVLTSVSRNFVAADVGNVINFTAWGSHGNATLPMRAQILSVSAGAATLDRNVTDGTATATGGSGYLGGCMASIIAAVFQVATSPMSAGNTINVKYGTLTFVGAITAGPAGTNSATITVSGFYSTPGDAPTIASGHQPTIALGAYTWTLGTFWRLQYLNVTTAATTTNYGLVTAANCYLVFCKFTQTSTGRLVNTAFAGTIVFGCEGSGGNNTSSAFTIGQDGAIVGCYIHDCPTSASGINAANSGALAAFNIVETCLTGIGASGSSAKVMSNTVVNCQTGIAGTTGYGGVIANNNVAFCGTGISYNVGYQSLLYGNNIYGCDTATSNAGSGAFTPLFGTTANPQFVTGVATGTTATTNASPGTTFTATGLLAGVTTNDFLCIWSGTGATPGVYAISSVSGLPNSITLATSPGNSASAMHWGIVKGDVATDLSLATASACNAAGWGIALGVASPSTPPQGAWGHAAFPAVGNVRLGVDRGDGTTGTCNVPAADGSTTLYGYAVDVSGTGTVTLPNTDGHTADASLVKNTAHFGAGNATAGTLDLSLYGLLSNYTDPGKTNVLAGHDYTYGGVTQTASLTLPAAGYVLTSAWGGPATYGVGGSGSTPTATLTVGANVLHTAAAFGAAGTSITPSASTYSEGQANQLATDQAAVTAGQAGMTTVTTILGVTGTLDLTTYTLKSSVVSASYVVTGHDNYTGGSAGTYPTTATSQAAQLATDQAAVTAGKAGMTTVTTILGVTGTLDLTTYTLKSGVVSASYVVTGHDNYTGGSAGTYPTTATSQAAQLATDQASVLASAAYILSGHSILSQAGTYDLAGHDAATAAAQLATDVAAVTAGKAGMTTATTILGVTGTLDLSTYVLKTDVVDAQWVAIGHDNYAGGQHGSFAGGGGGGVFPAAQYVHADAGSYGPTGTEYSPGLSALANWCLVAGITWPALDAVDGGATFGPITGTEYEGTGMNATTLLSTLGLATGNLDTQLAAIKAKTDLLSEGTPVTLLNPVDQSTDPWQVKIIRGDDYCAATGKPLPFSSGTWPNLTGAALLMTVRDVKGDGVVFTASPISVVAGGGLQSVTVELTHAQTLLLSPGRARYKADLQATWPSGLIDTIVERIVFNVAEDQTRPA